MHIEAQSMEEPKRKLARLEELIPNTANELGLKLINHVHVSVP
jgi:hypothetical protein